jgi:hypothetical protein
MSLKVNLGNSEIVIDRAGQNQDWQKRVVVVATPPVRYVGILSTDDEAQALEGKAFWVYAAVSYFCNVSVINTPEGQKIGAIPQILAGYDLVEPVQRVRICSPQHWFFAHEQSERLRELFIEGYLSVFDPPRVQLARPGTR